MRLHATWLTCKLVCWCAHTLALCLLKPVMAVSEAKVCTGASMHGP
jgi:hypothetical protein